MLKFALVKSLPLCCVRKSATDRIKGIPRVCWPNRQYGLHHTRPRQHEADASRPYRKTLRRRQDRKWEGHRENLSSTLTPALPKSTPFWLPDASRDYFECQNNPEMDPGGEIPHTRRNASCRMPSNPYDDSSTVYN